MISIYKLFRDLTSCFETVIVVKSTTDPRITNEKEEKPKEDDICKSCTKTKSSSDNRTPICVILNYSAGEEGPEVSIIPISEEEGSDNELLEEKLYKMGYNIDEISYLVTDEKLNIHIDPSLENNINFRYAD